MRPHPALPSVRAAVVVVLALAAGACVTRPSATPGAAMAAQLTLERFLQASNARDLEAMARLFGTDRGPVWETGGTLACGFKKIGSWFGGTACVEKREVEVRMDAIAQILRHEDYRVAREESVAGRLNRASRVFVDLTVNGQVISAVPFVLVRDGGGRWLVEEVDLQRVMAGAQRRGAPPRR